MSKKTARKAYRCFCVLRKDCWYAFQAEKKSTGMPYRFTPSHFIPWNAFPFFLGLVRAWGKCCENHVRAVDRLSAANSQDALGPLQAQSLCLVIPAVITGSSHCDVIRNSFGELSDNDDDDDENFQVMFQCPKSFSSFKIFFVILPHSRVKFDALLNWDIFKIEVCTASITTCY